LTGKLPEKLKESIAMDTASFVAALIGPIYILVGIGILLDPNHYQKMIEEFLHSPTLIYMGGAMALAAGLSILYFHNAWSSDWRVIITLFGWLACLKGAHLLIFPGHVSQLWSPMISNASVLRVVAVAALGLGIFLTAVAYGVL
jgi:uncharacterized protein YjeT (DUF2065 family)